MNIIFFFNDTATTEIYTLSLHDALPISLASPLESAIEKHAACAAAISSSGLVNPFGSSERAAQLTSRPPNAPLVTEATRPLPLIRSPRHVTSALRSVATAFSLRLFLVPVTRAREAMPSLRPYGRRDPWTRARGLPSARESRPRSDRGMA